MVIAFGFNTVHEVVDNVDELSSKITNINTYIGPFYLAKKEGGEILTKAGKKIRLLAGPQYHSIESVKEQSQSTFEQTEDKILLEVSKIYETQSQANTYYTDLQSSITQTAESINLEVSKKVGVGEVRDKFASESSSISINSGKITFETGTLVIKSSNFTLDEIGNAFFKGSITGSTIQFGDSSNNMVMH